MATNRRSETTRRQGPDDDNTTQPPLVLGAFNVQGRQVTARNRYRGDQDSLPSELATVTSPVLVQAELARAPEELYDENKRLQEQNSRLQAENLQLRMQQDENREGNQTVTQAELVCTTTEMQQIGNINDLQGARSRQMDTDAAQPIQNDNNSQQVEEATHDLDAPQRLSAEIDSTIRNLFVSSANVTSLPAVIAGNVDEGQAPRELRHADRPTRIREAEQEIEPAANTVDKEPEKGRKRDVYKALCIVVLLVVIGVGVGVPLSNRSSSTNDNSSKDEKTTPPTPTNFPTQQPKVFPSIAPVAPITNAPSPNGPFLQLGQDIDGKAEEDQFGQSVSLSADGSVIAVGADQVVNPGYVSVFQYNAQSQAWTTMGQDLVGQASGDDFGFSVSLSGNGTIVAVGARFNDQGGTSSGHVAVYEYKTNSGRWNQLGGDIVGQAAVDELGFSVSLSDAGDVMAVGAPGDDTSNGGNSGSVRLFQYNRGTASWDQQGQTLTGQGPRDEFGYSVSMSSSGAIVAIGAPDFRGQVSLYQYNPESSTWVPMGDPINGEVADSLFGFSVSLDASGSVLAVGAPGRFSSNPEEVAVFDFDSSVSAWTQRGQTLVYEGVDDNFGASVSLSHDGNVLAVGIPRGDPPGLTSAGQVRIYQYDASLMEWNTMVVNLNGNAVGDWFGNSVSLSGDGNVVGIGAFWGNPNALTNAGYAKLFTLTF